MILFACMLALPIVAQNNKFKMSEDTKKALGQLDMAVDEKSEYQEKLSARIDSVDNMLDVCPKEEYVDNCKRLYELSFHSNGRVCLKALQDILLSPEAIRDKDLRVGALLRMASVYSVMGLYDTVGSMLKSIKPSDISQVNKHIYFHTLYNNHVRTSQYAANITALPDYRADSVRLVLLDSLIRYQTNPVSLAAYEGEKAVLLGHPDKALRIMRPYQGKSSGLIKLRLGYAIAKAMQNKGNVDRQIYYLAKVSIQDIQEGRTDYKAMPELVQALYEVGEIDRAYRYLVCMLEDANIFPSRLLEMEVAHHFPLVHKKYAVHEAYMHNVADMRERSMLITYVILGLAIVVAFYMGWRYTNIKVQKRRADRLQKALEQANIAERVKQVFVQNMRHEIRTPLNAIIGFAQLMIADLPQEERELYYSYIQESNDKLLATLDDIIDVSNMETGVFNLKYEEVNIDTLCKEEMKAVQDTLNYGVALNYRPAENGMTINTDAKRLRQVLNHLLSNAIKNTTKGDVTLSVKRMPTTGRMQFVVTDTGVGIPPEKTSLIFENFEKVDCYSPGLGLGLYICTLIANVLSGKIYLDSTYTGGARFVYEIPNGIVDQKKVDDSQERRLSVDADIKSRKA